MAFNKKSILSLAATAILTIGMMTGCAPKTGTSSQEESGQEVVNIYSSRHYEVDKELYKQFEEETGIKVNVVEGKAPELLERLKREGADTQADLFITADIANIYQAIDAGLTQSINSEIVDENIPADLRGKDNSWIGLTTRARVIAYNKETINPEDIKTYDDLTKDQFNEEILVRSSDSTYNQSLLASFIELNGEEKAKEWAQGVVNNMARTPEGGDRDQVKAIAAGEGDIAILNTYYYGKMLNSEEAEEVKAAKSVGIIFPEDTHVNISGVVMTKDAKNTENAIKFVDFMTGKDAQERFAGENFEYPANPKAEVSEELKSWGEFTPQTIDLTKVGEYNKRAVEIFNEVGWK